MKVYVSELPIGAIEFGCDNCPYAEIQGINHYFIKNKFVSYRDCVCKLDKTCGFKDGQKTCPLQSLADYTKQVRKEVCDNFRKIAMQYYTTDDKGNLILTCNDVWDILSKLQGEDK